MYYILTQRLMIWFMIITHLLIRQYSTYEFRLASFNTLLNYNVLTGKTSSGICKVEE